MTTTAAMDKSQVFTVVGIAAVSAIFFAVIWSVATSPRPYVANMTGTSTNMATGAIGVITSTNGYMYSNYTKLEPCKDDPGVVCFVPVKVKVPLPAPNIKPLLPTS